MNGQSEDGIGDDQSLLESGIIDSLGIMKLLSFVEERFEIKISDDELLPENFESIVTISYLVDEKIKASRMK